MKPAEFDKHNCINLKMYARNALRYPLAAKGIVSSPRKNCIQYRSKPG